MTNAPAPAAGRRSGAAAPWLRAEGAAVLLLCVVTYAHLGASWWLAVLLFLAPDLSMAGYLAGPRVGALTYNLAHSYALAVGLGLLAQVLDQQLLLALALILAAHIGFDRALGYGLKLPEGFHATHLGPIGPGSERPALGLGPIDRLDL